MQSNKDSISWSDFKKWIKETIIFSIPADIVFITALQGGVDWKVAAGAGLATLGTCLLNLFRKYSAGVESTPINNIPSFSTPYTMPVTSTTTMGSTMAPPGVTETVTNSL